MNQGTLLGPFALAEPIASGGMGEVWRATHAESGLPVAIKLVSAATAPEAHAAIDNEIRAVAGLDHPNVAWLYDRGVVDATAASRLDGAIAEGTPWFAMELAEGGTLRSEFESLGWTRLQSILLQVLAALAHAHAHGIVHRDVKPANILMGAGSRVMLADFGIAWALDQGEGESGVSELVGTPSYMAPEQILLQAEAHGPWTDLYALGCVAYQAVCGQPPFRRKSTMRTLRAHLRDPMPPLAPRFAVPRDLASWLARLTHKDPAHRFRLAADAAHALATLEPVEPVEPVEAVDPGPAAPPSLHDADTVILDSPLPPAPVIASDEPRPTGDAPPIGAHEASQFERPARLAGAGLGLYGLRALPMVGRTPERDALWNELCAVASEGRPRVVLLGGPSGTGKSRLASWLAVRAHELGAAHALRGHHHEHVGAGDGLAGVIERDLRCRGLERDAAAERVKEALEALGLAAPEETQFFVEFLRPSDAPDPGAGPDRSRPRELSARLRAYLRARAADRPVILWLDDLQWGPESLRVVHRWLGENQHLPVLVVATVQLEALDADTATEIDALAALPGATRLHIGPLGPADHGALIDALLDLEPALARRLAERTQGNPLFAVQVLEDWVRRRQLAPGAHGFVLHGDGRALPESLAEVWGPRVAELLKRRSTEDRAALELAATLGMDVDPDEWSQACAWLGAVPDPSLVDALVAQRLATTDAQGGGWSFVHAMLREAVLDASRDGDRAAAHHLACAEVIRSRGGRGADARRGRHLRLAGKPLDAIAPLHLAAARARHDGDASASERYHLETIRAADEAGLAPDAPERLRTEADLVSVYYMQSRDAEGEALFHSIVRRCGDRHPGLLAFAEQSMSGAQVVRGRLDEGVRYGMASFERATAAGALQVSSNAATTLADVAMRRGRLDEAARWFHQALDHGRRAGSSQAQLNSWFGLAWIAVERRDVDQVKEPWGQAMELATRIESRALLARLVNVQGEVARIEGRQADALRHYAEATRLLEGLGAPDSCYGSFNQGLILCQDADFAAADALFVATLQTAEAHAERLGIIAAHHGLLLTRVTASDADVEHHEAMGPAAAERDGLAVADFAELTEQAGQRALAAGHEARGRRLLATARRQREATG